MTVRPHHAVGHGNGQRQAGSTGLQRLQVGQVFAVLVVRQAVAAVVHPVSVHQVAARARRPRAHTVDYGTCGTVTAARAAASTWRVPSTFTAHAPHQRGASAPIRTRWRCAARRRLAGRRQLVGLCHVTAHQRQCPALSDTRARPLAYAPARSGLSHWRAACAPASGLTNPVAPVMNTRISPPVQQRRQRYGAGAEVQPGGGAAGALYHAGLSRTVRSRGWHGMADSNRYPEARHHEPRKLAHGDGGSATRRQPARSVQVGASACAYRRSATGLCLGAGRRCRRAGAAAPAGRRQRPRHDHLRRKGSPL